MIRLRVGSSPGEHRVVAEDGGVLHDVALWRPARPDGIGDVLRARVVARVPAMAGSFLALPDGPDGFLPDSEGGKHAAAGAILTVRVTRAAQGGKGKRLSAVVPQTEGPVGLVARGPSPLEELAVRYAAAPILVDDPGLAAGLAPAFGARVQLVRRAMEAELAGAFEALAGTEAALPGGMRASIHPTPALVAIDVDMGAATATGGEKRAVQRSFNEAAVPALVRQIRLRNLSGAIVIDFAGMATRARAVLAPSLEAALATDPGEPRWLGFTRLGLAEILRPRRRPPLHELLSGPHAAGLQALAGIDRAAAAEPAARFRVRAAPDVAAAIEADAAARADLARRTGRALMMVSDPRLAPGVATVERED